MYLDQIVLKNLQGELVVPRVGDELIERGFPAHKRVFVGAVGSYGENVVDPAKRQSACLVHLQSIPNWEQLIVGQRGPEDWGGQVQVQARACEVLTNGVVNRTLGPNCEHICSYIRTGKAESPQLKVAAGLGIAAVIFLWAQAR